MNTLEVCEHNSIRRSCEICEKKEEIGQLRTELKNFLAAFDEYFCRGWILREDSLDAKQAMFSAANQARKLLGDGT